jgi:hypothetical protein
MQEKSIGFAAKVLASARSALSAAMTRSNKVPAAAAAPEDAELKQQLPELSQAVADCVASLDDGLRAAEKAWASGALLPKVNPRRIERVLEALESRDAVSISSLIVEIVAPDNAVSPVAVHTARNNVMRDQFARGAMGAVMAAIIDVEKAHRAGPLLASGLLSRVRTWVAYPGFRQVAGLETDDRDELELANDALCNIASDILEGSDEQSAAMVRLGIVGPLAIALQITQKLQETPPAVLGLQVSGFEHAAIAGAEA